MSNEHAEDVKQDVEVEVVKAHEEVVEEEVGQVALDVLEEAENVFVIAPIAGVNQEDIDISLNKTVLTIKGSRTKPEEYHMEGIKMRNSECFWGKFARNIILPENLALNKIKAYMENNLLVVTIPKLRFDSRTIKINNVEGKVE